MEDESSKESKIERIKRHFRENKKIYIVSGATAVGTAIAVSLFWVKIGKTEEQVIADTYNKIFTRFAGLRNDHNNITYQTISIYGNKLGRPGVPVIDKTTGKRFESMTLAARSVGVDVSKLWKHLNGDLDHIQDHVFEIAE